MTKYYFTISRDGKFIFRTVEMTYDVERVREILCRQFPRSESFCVDMNQQPADWESVQVN